ncbi:unnamed protein product, partial [Ixodes persulcatus]
MSATMDGKAQQVDDQSIDSDKKIGRKALKKTSRPYRCNNSNCRASWGTSGGSVAEWSSAHQLGARGAKARAAEPRDP